MSFLFPSSAPASVQASASSPTLLQRASLLALPAGSSSGRSTRGNRRNRRLTRLVREGQMIGRFFNEIAGRPYPSFSGIEQQIRVTLTLPNQGFFTTSAVAVTYASTAFALSSFGNVAEYTGLFDQYMIEQLELWLEPATSGASYPTLATAVDLDDANMPTTFDQVAGKQAAMVGGGGPGRYMCWKPHIAVALYSGVFTSFGNEPSTWIDSASPSVQHFGFKLAATAGPAAVVYNLTTRAVVSFRGAGV